MQEEGVNRLPVVDEHGAPVGIVTRDDVLRAIAARVRGRAAGERPPRRRSQMPPD
jgi:CBS domain-containing protein